jgi:hypothetical protein
MEMVLKKDGAQIAKGGFEDDSAPAATATAEAAAQPTIAEKATADVAATTAVAAAGAATSVAVRDNGPTDVIGDLQNKFEPVGFGAIERLKGSNGQVFDSQNKPLGASVNLDLLSWNYLWTLSPGSDKPDAKELVKYSTDGKTVEGTGQDVNEYIKALREVHGYEKAAIKQYVSLIGILTASEKSSAHVGNVVEVSLSPVAAKKFSSGHRLQMNVKRRQGAISAEDAAKVVIRAEVTTNGKNQTYTYLNVAEK